MPTKKTAEKPKAEKPAASHLVKMVREAETNPAPHSADVHPAEVENFKAGGWQEA